MANTFKPRSRAEKIKFLKDLAEGKADINVLREPLDLDLLTIAELNRLLRIKLKYQTEHNKVIKQSEIDPDDNEFLTALVKAVKERPKDFNSVRLKTD